MLKEKYFKNMKEVLEKVERTQKQNIEEAARLVVESLINDGAWHVYDTSHMLMHEGVGRAGGVMALKPLEFSFKVDNSVRARKRDEEGSRSKAMDTVDMCKLVMSKSKILPGDVIVIGHDAGKKVMPLELALTAKKRGVKTIALTSIEYSKHMKSEHPSGKLLHEVCDIVIDTCDRYGDSVVDVEELGRSICPSSGMSACYILWALQAEVVETFLKKGIEPSTYISVHMPDGRKQNAKMKERYEKLGY